MIGFGSTEIAKAYLGGTEISKMYLGDELVFGGEPIPVPYDAEIEYLQSSRTQWIDTGIIPNASTGLYLKAECSNNADYYLIGLRDATGNTRWCIGHDNYFYYGYGSFAFITKNIKTLSAELWLNYQNDKKATALLNGNTYSVTLPSLSFTPINNIRLFGSSGVSASYSKWPGKIYFVKISQGNDIIMDLIPVRVGQVGYMYDKISRELFRNSGTGNFILGPDVT